MRAARHVVRAALRALGSQEMLSLSGAVYGLHQAFTFAGCADHPISTCLVGGLAASLYGTAAVVAGNMLGQLAPIVPIALLYSVVCGDTLMDPTTCVVRVDLRTHDAPIRARM